MVNDDAVHSPDRDPRGTPEFEVLLAEYVEELNLNGFVDPERILEQHPEIGRDLLEDLRTYVQLRETGDGDATLGTLGDYTLRRQIGRGGMGVVYEAWQNSLDRGVALKVLPSGVAADNKAFMRFMREAKTAAQLNHPHIVSVYGMGVESHTPWYSMEYVEGETLAHVITKRQDGPVGDAETLFGRESEGLVYYARIATAFAGVAEGLQHAHSRGVIHRDIKPSNLILDSEGRLRILDFGLARFEGQESLTVSGDFVGTPLYMSPEQARRWKIPIDHRTDIYSLGATMYETLSGRPPFRGKDHQDTLSQIIERDPVEPVKLNPRVPGDLQTIVLKCLRKDPGERYGTAEALAQELRRFVRGDPIEARPASKFAVLGRRAWRHRWRLVAATFVVILVMMTALVLNDRRLRERERLHGAYAGEVESASLAIEAFTCAASLGTGNMRLVDPYGMMASDFKYFIPRRAGRPDEDPLVSLAQSLGRTAGLRPERPEAHYVKARALALLGRTTEAIAEATVALEKDLTFEPARFLRESLGGGETQNLEGRTWQGLWREAHRALGESRWKEAAAVFGELHAVYQRDGEPYAGAAVETLLGRGRARLEAEEYRLAIEDLIEAKRSWPGVLAPTLLLGKAYYLSRREEWAEETFRELLDQEGHAQVEPLAGDPAVLIHVLYDSLADWERAFAWAERIRDEAFRDVAKAACRLQGHRHREAESFARAAVSRDPSLLLGHVILGQALCARGQYGEAEQVFENMIAQDPRHPSGHTYLGSLLCRQGKWEAGYSELNEALALSPDFYQARHYLGTAYAWQGRFEEAETTFTQILEEHPRSIHDLGWLGWVSMKRGRYDTAVASYEKALALNPGYADAHYGLGLVCLERSQPAIGIDHICRAIEHLPDHPGTYDPLIPYLTSGKRLECRQELQKLIDLIEKRLDETEDDRGFLKAIEVLALAGLHATSEENHSLAIRLLERGCRVARETNDDAVSWRLQDTLARHREAVSPALPTCESVDAALDRGDTDVIIGAGDEWRFFPGREEPSTEPLEWTAPDFDDSSWNAGPSGFGYGGRRDGTRLEEMKGSSSTLYIRGQFTLDDPADYERFLLQVFADDGFVAYLDGEEIARARVDPARRWIPFDGVASWGHSSWVPTVVELGPERLGAGRSVLAVQGLNRSVDDTGFYVLPVLLGDRAHDPSRDERLLEQYRGVAAGKGSADRLLYVEGRMHQRTGRHDEAAATFRELAGKDGAAPEPAMRLAETLLASGERSREDDVPRAALEASGWPDLWEAWVALALRDLRHRPGEILNEFPFPAAAADEPDGAARHVHDLRWLLERLDAGDGIRINCGGEDYTGHDGRRWSRDRFFRGGRESKARDPEMRVEGTQDEPLYTAGRWFPRFPRTLVRPAYRFPVPLGEYRVVLHFAETFFQEKGRRVFQVLVEGEKLPGEIQFAVGRAERIIVETRVDDGLLDIDFAHGSANNPTISAIEIDRVR